MMTPFQYEHHLNTVGLNIIVRLPSSPPPQNDMQCLSSLIQSITNASHKTPQMKFKLIVITDLEFAKKSQVLLRLNSAEIPTQVVSYDIHTPQEFLRASYQWGRDNASGLIYFVSADCLHDPDCITEMLENYFIFCQKLQSDVCMTPYDHPVSYDPNGIIPSRIVAGSKRHWRTNRLTAPIFMISKNNLLLRWKELTEFTPYYVGLNHAFECVNYLAFDSIELFSPLPALASLVQSPLFHSPFCHQEKWSNPNQNVGSSELAKSVSSEKIQPNVKARNFKSADLQLVVIASHNARGLNDLLKSCHRKNIPVKILAWGQPFPGLSWKPKVMQRWLNSDDHRKYFMFLDAFDTIVLDRLDTIFKKFLEFDFPFVMSAETNCHPDPSIAENYPKRPNPFRFVNGGAYICETSYFKELLSKFPVEQTADWVDDQSLFADFYLKNQDRVALDWECRIFQSVFRAFPYLIEKNQRVFNILTNTYPSVLHFNGEIDPTPIMSWLRKHLFESDPAELPELPELPELSALSALSALSERETLSLSAERFHNNPQTTSHIVPSPE